MISPWHKPLKRVLEQGISQGRLGQTLLLESSSVDGGYDVSKWLVKRLLCQSSDTHKPCGQCHACHMIAAETHPDQFKIITESNTIGVDEIRELTDWSVQRPRYGQAKVAVIMPADKLTVSAANALLKILEEPKQQNYFILIKSFQSRLLPTIISRAQRYIVPTPSKKEAVQWLKSEFSDIQDSELIESIEWVSDDPIEVHYFLSSKGLELLKSFKEAVEALNLGQIEPLQKILEDHPYMLNWLGKVIIHSMRREFGAESTDTSVRLRGIPKPQLMLFYQEFIQLNQKLKDNSSLNYSMQLYPLLSQLIPKSGGPRVN